MIITQDDIEKVYKHMKETGLKYVTVKNVIKYINGEIPYLRKPGI